MSVSIYKCGLSHHQCGCSYRFNYISKWFRNLRFYTKKKCYYIDVHFTNEQFCCRVRIFSEKQIQKFKECITVTTMSEIKKENLQHKIELKVISQFSAREG